MMDLNQEGVCTARWRVTSAASSGTVLVPLENSWTSTASSVERIATMSAGRPINFGVFVPQGWRMDLVEISDLVEKYATMTRVAQVADHAGYDSIWVFDHFTRYQLRNWRRRLSAGRGAARGAVRARPPCRHDGHSRRKACTANPGDGPRGVTAALDRGRTGNLRHGHTARGRAQIWPA